MLTRRLARVVLSLSRNAESLLSSTSRLSLTSLHASQAAAESNAAANTFEIKDKSGARLTGSQYLDLVRERIGAPKEEAEGEEWSVPKSAFTTLIGEYDNVLEESKEWKDRYARALAETENVRKRGLKQVEETKAFAIQGFCKDLLEVADILDLAVDSVKPDALQAGSAELRTLHDGVVMTKQVLLKTFERHELVPSNPVGEPFDPNLHEAVYQVPKEQAKQPVGHIEHVMKIGYYLKGRPIRAAQVGVVKE